MGGGRDIGAAFHGDLVELLGARVTAALDAEEVADQAAGKQHAADLVVAGGHPRQDARIDLAVHGVDQHIRRSGVVEVGEGRGIGQPVIGHRPAPERDRPAPGVVLGSVRPAVGRHLQEAFFQEFPEAPRRPFVARHQCDQRRIEREALRLVFGQHLEVTPFFRQ